MRVEVRAPPSPSRIDSHARYRRTASSRSCSAPCRPRGRPACCGRGAACCRATRGSPSPRPRPRCRPPSVRMLRGQHDQPRIEVVGHVRARARQRMDAREVAGLAQVGAQPLVQLLRHLVGIALELLGAVLGELGDRRLRRVPEARPVLVEVGRRRGEPPQRIAEHGRRLARHHAAELDAPVLEAAVRRRRRRRRAEVDRARHAPRRVRACRGSAARRRSCSGSEFGPSTSFSMIGAQLSER